MTPPPLSFVVSGFTYALVIHLYSSEKYALMISPYLPAVEVQAHLDRRRLAGVHHWERSSLLPVYYQVDSALHETPLLKHMVARLWKRFNGRMRP